MIRVSRLNLASLFFLAATWRPATVMGIQFSSVRFSTMPHLHGRGTRQLLRAERVKWSLIEFDSQLIDSTSGSILVRRRGKKEAKMPILSLYNQPTEAVNTMRMPFHYIQFPRPTGWLAHLSASQSGQDSWPATTTRKSATAAAAAANLCNNETI